VSKSNKEILCIKRLDELTNQIGDILLFLKNEDLISDIQIKEIKNSSDLHKSVQNLLSTLKSQNKLQMLSYTWSVLPVENISLLIITDRNNIEFSYHG
jgi:hypothetical protein